MWKITVTFDSGRQLVTWYSKWRYIKRVVRKAYKSTIVRSVSLERSQRDTEGSALVSPAKNSTTVFTVRGKVGRVKEQTRKDAYNRGASDFYIEALCALLMLQSDPNICSKTLGRAMMALAAIDEQNNPTG